jgi:hypothetical protein
MSSEIFSDDTIYKMMTESIGSRAKVFHERAMHTPGGLTRADLIQSSDGRIKSKAAVAAALKRAKGEGAKAMTAAFKAKKGKGKFKLQPKKGTAEYKKKIAKM